MAKQKLPKQEKITNGNQQKVRDARNEKLAKQFESNPGESDRKQKRSVSDKANGKRGDAKKVLNSQSKPGTGFQGRCVLNPGGTPLDRLR